MEPPTPTLANLHYRDPIATFLVTGHPRLLHPPMGILSLRALPRNHPLFHPQPRRLCIPILPLGILQEVLFPTHHRYFPYRQTIRILIPILHLRLISIHLFRCTKMAPVVEHRLRMPLIFRRMRNRITHRMTTTTKRGDVQCHMQNEGGQESTREESLSDHRICISFFPFFLVSLSFGPDSHLPFLISCLSLVVSTHISIPSISSSS